MSISAPTLVNPAPCLLRQRVSLPHKLRGGLLFLKHSARSCLSPGHFLFAPPPRSLHLPGGSGYTATWKGQHSFSECFMQDLCVRGRTWPVDFLPGHKLKLLFIGRLGWEAHACYFSFESAVGSSPAVLCCGCHCCFLFFLFFWEGGEDR